jgi:hypothetical protein
MNYYYIEGNNGWFVCYAITKKEALKCGKSELWDISTIRLATTEEIDNYCRIKGIDENIKSEIIGKDKFGFEIWAKISKEKNRQLHLKYN